MFPLLVIHVDVEKNQSRRQALRAVLEGRTKRFERYRRSWKEPFLCFRPQGWDEVYLSVSVE